MTSNHVLLEALKLREESVKRFFFSDGGIRMGLELSHLEKELDRFANLYIDSYLRAAGLAPAVAGLKPCATPTTVPLNYEEMEAMYKQHGTRGVYAYLIERGIAKDKTHGDFLIEDIFLPEYTKRNGTTLRLIK